MKQALIYQVFSIRKPLPDADFNIVYQILNNAFPKTEKRTKADQKQILKEQWYHVMTAKIQNEMIGFLGYWDFDRFRYVEHFAISPTFRGGGAGSDLLQQFLNASATPVVLEVEMPENEIAQRRIRFYERNGFFTNDYAYEQPPLQAGQPNLPLILMTYPEVMRDAQLDEIKKTLYRFVYKTQ